MVIWFGPSINPIRAAPLQGIDPPAPVFKIFDLTIGQARLHDFLSRLGPTILFSDDSKPDLKCICYISDRDETMILIKSANQGTGLN